MIDLDDFKTYKDLDGKGQLKWMGNWSMMIKDSFSKGVSLILNN